MTKEEIIALYLFTGRSIPFIQDNTECSKEEIEEVRKNTDLTICPSCCGSGYVRFGLNGDMKRCYCREVFLYNKYMKPLKPFENHYEIIPEKGLPDFSGNIHRVISADYSTDQVKFLFAYMLKRENDLLKNHRQEYKYLNYEYLTIYDLRDISYKEHDDYRSFTQLKSKVLLINAVVLTNSQKYLNVLDDILAELLFIRENAVLPVWAIVSKNKFPVTHKYIQINQKGKSG